jgi:hypothetical protein
MTKSLCFIFLLISTIQDINAQITKENLHVSPQSNRPFLLNNTDLINLNHTNLCNIFAQYITGYNLYVLKAIDHIQRKFQDGGTYFTGIKSNPPESPIGYNLKFMGKELLNAPRTSSYCSGATYTAFIECMNLILDSVHLDSIRYDAIRMQEWDGGRREDGIKLWGNWNADGYGSYDALVSYSGIGIEIKPEEAIPGDFMNISWKSGNGHSVVFLGWHKEKDQTSLVYWSSQKSTNGLGIVEVNIDKIKDVVLVRITEPENILSFNPSNKVDHATGQNLEFLSR